jgi:hypothetical protein
MAHASIDAGGCPHFFQNVYVAPDGSQVWEIFAAGHDGAFRLAVLSCERNAIDMVDALNSAASIGS